MKINLSIEEIENYLRSLQTENIAQGETNAFRYFDLGQQAALKDTLHLIAVFKEKFINHLPQVYKTYSKTLHPDSDGDRSNADSYLLDGYKDIINKFINVK